MAEEKPLVWKKREETDPYEDKLVEDQQSKEVGKPVVRVHLRDPPDPREKFKIRWTPLRWEWTLVQHVRFLRPETQDLNLVESLHWFEVHLF